MGYNSILETERIYIRPVDIKDAPDMYIAMQDKTIQKFMLNPPFRHVNECYQYLSLVKAYGTDYSIIEKGSKRFIGMITLTHRSLSDCWELGYWTTPNMRNKGYTEEALRGFIKWCFEMPSCNVLYADIALVNRASQNLIQKLGFTYECDALCADAGSGSMIPSARFILSNL